MCVPTNCSLPRRPCSKASARVLSDLIAVQAKKDNDRTIYLAREENGNARRTLEEMPGICSRPMVVAYCC